MKIKSLILIFISQFCKAQSNPANYTTLPDDGKCRVLAMRGGGTKGAYEVGALKAMADMLEPIDIAYDVLAGVSIGALNAAMFATFERGQEREAIEAMEHLWRTTAVMDLWDNWPTFGPLAVFYKQSMFDNSKMRRMVHEVMEGTWFKRML